MKLLNIALTFFVVTNIGFAQNINTQKLDTYFKTLEANNKFMGSVAILMDGQLVYDKQVGYVDVESKQKPNKYTKYRIGSVSKVFTATLVFKTIEEGRITLEETIESYFPEIENANKITVSHLLYHRSGIHDFTGSKEEYLNFHMQPKTEKEMVEIIANGGSDFYPDEKAGYSNSNYVLLSFILEKIYNEPFAKILEDKITKPLNLSNTLFGSQINGSENESYGYRFEKKWERTKESHPSIGMGAGGIVSTPTDLVHFAEALFNNELLSPESVAKMRSLQDNFGMGLFKIEYHDKISYGHNGEIDGFTSVLRYFPDEKMAFAITSNAIEYSLNAITVTIVNSLFNKHFDIPDFRTYEPTAKELNQYLGVYSSETFPVKLIVTKVKKQLYIMAPGDSEMKMLATAKGEFKYEPAGISIVFDANKNQLRITQGGKTNVLDKE